MHASMAPFERLPAGGSSAWERAGVWCWRAQHVRHVSRGLYSSSFRRFLLAPDAPARRRERSALSLNPLRTASFGERQLGAMPIAPTALTVFGGLPASRAPDMLCRIDSSTTFTFSFI